MTDERIEALDSATRCSVVMADCLKAARELARAHLSGPRAAAVLAQALAGVSLLGAETSETDETVTLRMDCPGPLGGFLVEATEKGTLRGYTVRKTLGELDDLERRVKDSELLGDSATVQVIRSTPGRIVSTGSVAIAGPTVAGALDAYYGQSLQRLVRVVAVSATDENGDLALARALSVECAPDGDRTAFAALAGNIASGAVAKALASPLVSARKILSKLGLPRAEIRRTAPLAFACRCSAERALAALAALSPADRGSLGPTLDVTCHLCGRTWSVPTS